MGRIRRKMLAKPDEILDNRIALRKKAERQRYVSKGGMALGVFRDWINRMMVGDYIPETEPDKREHIRPSPSKGDVYLRRTRKGSIPTGSRNRGG